MKYPNIKKTKLTHQRISELFGFKNVHSFRNTTSHKTYMEGIDKLIGIVIENIKSKI